MAEKIIQMIDAAKEVLYPVIISDNIPDSSIDAVKIKDNNVGENKLDTDIVNNIDRNKSIMSSLLQALGKDREHFIDPFVKAGIIPIPFKDPEVKRILVENYDKDGDGELYYKDVQKITSLGDKLFADNQKIKSFREFRFFGTTVIENGGSNYWDKAIGQGSGVFENSTLENIEFPQTLKDIGRRTFFNCSNLNFDKLPDSLETLRGGCFMYCTNLTLSELPTGLKNLAEGFIFNNTSVSISVMPEGVTVIPSNGLFPGTKVTHLDILSTELSKIGYEGLNFNTLQYVILHTETPPSLYKGAIYKNAIIYVPDNAVDAYKAATNWSDYTDNIKPISEKPTT